MVEFESEVALAPWTTLGVGGPARRFARVGDEAALVAALATARAEGWETFILGGGSNLLVADEGFAGAVIRPEDARLEVIADDGARVRLRAGAGVVWDALVAACVERGLAGVTCLSGIPGLVGAAPIQNIGAYGQEVAEVIEEVHVVERATGRALTLGADQCGFGYRWSRFKGDWRDRFVVVAVTFGLRREAVAPLRYGDLQRHFGGATEAPLAQVREAVLSIRRDKSMVYDATDPNHRSAGSFFVNPVISEAQAAEVEARAVALLGPEGRPPRFPASEGMVKLPAAWLIERAGYSRGFAWGRAALSSRHTLALINPGQATAADLVALAGELRRGVFAAFGVALHPEPVALGFGPEALATLHGPLAGV